MMTESLNKLTIGHFLYVMGAGLAVGFFFVLLDRYVIAPIEPKFGVSSAGPVI